jgi:hypothetical protein
MFSVTYFTALPGGGFQQWMFLFLWVSELSPASATETLNCLQNSEFRVTLRLAVCRQSLRLGAKHLQDHDQRFLFATEPLR